jgi:hypothetical protein
MLTTVLIGGLIGYIYDRLSENAMIGGSEVENQIENDKFIIKIIVRNNEPVLKIIDKQKRSKTGVNCVTTKMDLLKQVGRSFGVQEPFKTRKQYCKVLTDLIRQNSSPVELPTELPVDLPVEPVPVPIESLQSTARQVPDEPTALQNINFIENEAENEEFIIKTILRNNKVVLKIIDKQKKSKTGVTCETTKIDLLKQVGKSFGIQTPFKTKKQYCKVITNLLSESYVQRGNDDIQIQDIQDIENGYSLQKMISNQISNNQQIQSFINSNLTDAVFKPPDNIKNQNNAISFIFKQYKDTNTAFVIIANRRVQFKEKSYDIYNSGKIKDLRQFRKNIGKTSKTPVIISDDNLSILRNSFINDIIDNYKKILIIQIESNEILDDFNYNTEKFNEMNDFLQYIKEKTTVQRIVMNEIKNERIN